MAGIITTTLHEAYPGHHLQMTFAALHPRLMRRYVFTPILAEGWALYCEQFMKDLRLSRGASGRAFLAQKSFMALSSGYN